VANTKITVFADGQVGLKILEFLIAYYYEFLNQVVVIDENSEIYEFLKKNNYTNIITNKELYSEKSLNSLKKSESDYFILAWWPNIIKKNIYELPKIGTINFHPSYLPYNRGKHYNFWTIVEDTPFGVTLHFVDDKIDGGDIIFQKVIDKTWEDTGKTLYDKAKLAMVELFVDSFPKILNNDYKRRKQNLEINTYHFAKDLDKVCTLYLEKEYVLKNVLNILRARTFEGHPACFFYDNNKKYEVRIDIKECK